MRPPGEDFELCFSVGVEGRSGLAQVRRQDASTFNDAAQAVGNNQFSQTVTILPITGQPAAKHYPFEVSVPMGVAGLTANSRIKANQIRTVDKRRLVAFRDSLPPEYLPMVEKALKIHLNMG